MSESVKSLRVLVVEDEFIIADEIAAIVEAAGHSVLGPVASIDDALAILAEERPGFAVIDANLRGQSSASLARRLDEMGVAFCICTGYRADDLRPTFGDVVLIQKPVKAGALVAALRSVAAQHAAERR
jgi:DNA-binding response OmpR family regulator